MAPLRLPSFPGVRWTAERRDPTTPAAEKGILEPTGASGFRVPGAACPVGLGSVLEGIPELSGTQDSENDGERQPDNLREECIGVSILQRAWAYFKGAVRGASPSLVSLPCRCPLSHLPLGINHVCKLWKNWDILHKKNMYMYTWKKKTKKKNEAGQRSGQGRPASSESVEQGWESAWNGGFVGQGSKSTSVRSDPGTRIPGQLKDRAEDLGQQETRNRTPAPSIELDPGHIVFGAPLPLPAWGRTDHA